MMILAYTVPLALNMATSLQQSYSPWSVVLTPNGSTTTTYSAGSSTYVWSALQTNPNFSGDFGSDVRGSNCSVTSSGSISFKFTWNPSTGPTPTRNFVQFQNVAGAEGTGAGGVSVNASNGVESLSASGASSQFAGVRASKIEYKGFSDGGDLSLSLSAYFSAPGNSGGNGFTSIKPGFTILPGYTLFNHDLEDGGNFKKGANGRTPNLPTPDGDKELDSVVRITATGLYAGTSDDLDGRYGFWYAQHHDWTVVGDGTPVGEMRIALDENAAEVPISLTLAGDRDALALNAQTRFLKTVTDSNDFSAPVIRSRYVVTWHLPYENWEEAGAASDYIIRPKVEIIQRPNDPPGNGESIDVKLNYQEAWIQTAMNGTAIALDVTSGFLPAPYGGLCNAASITVDKLTPKDEIVHVNFSYLWDQPDSTPGRPPRPLTASNGWQVDSIYRKLTYKEQNWNGDMYASNGYGGRTSRTTYTLKEKGWYADFSPISGGTGSPGGGGNGGTNPPSGPTNPGGTPPPAPGGTGV